ncbi:uncharacterized protein LOC110702009 [Chenopodium quinoa]|uniref:uncharacterized protein LOC110702009 n=1 Tax=Chenopodium quinoa TaxID=63459 RepID=UPI000B78D1E4|nr:uncharacterized protein LOC110702009 [Chenopodium quinoa]
MILAIQGLQHYEFAEHSSNEPFPEEQFIINALKKYPVLFCQTNRFGETPLHLEVFHKMWQIRDGTQLYRMIKEELMNLKGRGELPLPPWKLKDVQGNTTLHYAAKYGNYEFEIDANLVGELNHSKQTPLHLLCQKHFDSGNQMMMAKLLIEKDASTVYARDIEGFTPLLRAAQHLWTTDFILEIVKQHPQSIRQIDPHARNFFHHLKYFASKEKLCEIAPQKESEILITQKDDQGYTPFDLAVQKRHFSKARLLIECCDLRGECFKTWLFHHNESSREMIDADQISFQEFM